MKELTRDKKKRYQIRKWKIRKKISGTSEVPRLVLHSSLRYLYAQIVDDTLGKTLVSCTSLGKDAKGDSKGSKNIDSAKILGNAIAEKASATGLKKVVFDRNGKLYHGKVKAFAEAAREKGLEF
jgi:large subunit ribosomal protein L18